MYIFMFFLSYLGPSPGRDPVRLRADLPAGPRKVRNYHATYIYIYIHTYAYLSLSIYIYVQP